MQPAEHPWSGRMVLLTVPPFSGAAPGRALLVGRFSAVTGLEWGPRILDEPLVAPYLRRIGPRGRDEPLYVMQRGVPALVHSSEVSGVIDEPCNGDDMRAVHVCLNHGTVYLDGQTCSAVPAGGWTPEAALMEELRRKMRGDE